MKDLDVYPNMYTSYLTQGGLVVAALPAWSLAALYGTR